MYSRQLIVCLLVLVLAACGPANRVKAPEQTAPVTASPIDELQRVDFATYHVDPYAGRKHAPDLSGARRGLRGYRSALSAAVDAGPNFAGRYSLAQIGCGASCTTVYLIDVSNGAIDPVMFGGEFSPYALELEFHPDSTLLKAHWQMIDSQANPVRCDYENFVLRQGHLVSLGGAYATGRCPLPE